MRQRRLYGDEEALHDTEEVEPLGRKKSGWGVIIMKDDWKRLFSSEP